MIATVAQPRNMINVDAGFGRIFQSVENRLDLGFITKHPKALIRAIHETAMNWEDIRTRLREARWTFLSGLVVIMTLVWTAQVSPQAATWVAAGGILVVMFVTALVPRRSGMKRRRQIVSKGQKARGPSEGVKRFTSAFPDPVYILDGQGNLIFTNAAAAKTFGTARLGAPFLFKFRNPEIASMVEQVLLAPAHSTCEFHEKLPAEQYYNVSITPVWTQVKLDPATARPLSSAILDYFIVAQDVETALKALT